MTDHGLTVSSQAPPQWSSDGRYWWNGQFWVEVDRSPKRSLRRNRRLISLLGIALALLVGVPLALVAAFDYAFGDPHDTWVWNGAGWRQADWGWWSVPTSCSPAMAFDASRDQLILVSDGETWQWRDSRWTRLETKTHLPTLTSPCGLNSPSMQYALTYDGQRSEIVLFGDGKTWTWDGADWTLRSSTGPGARVDMAMVYDAAAGVTVLFGGTSAGDYGQLGDDTWLWNGTKWSIAPGSLEPGRMPPGNISGMTYDEDAGRVFLLTGRDLSGERNILQEWTWDQSDGWLRRNVTTGPDFGLRPVVAYDPTRKKPIVFASGSVTMSYDGSEWTTLPTASSPRYRDRAAVAANTNNHTIVLFGGCGVCGIGA